MVFDILGLVIAFVLEEIGDGGVCLVKRPETQPLFCLFHGAEQDRVGDPFVAVDGDFVDFDFFGFFNIKKKINGIFDFFVRDLLHIHITAEEAFVNIVFADNILARDDHVVIHDIALGDVEFFAEIVFLAFCSALEAECAESGAVLKTYIQEDEVALHAGGRNLHVLVQTSVP